MKTSRRWESCTTMDELFDAVAKDRPHAVAVTDGVSSFTYAELKERSIELAESLKDAGTTPGDLVGIRVGRNAQTVVGIIAVWRVGAAYVPLDPTYPEARVRFMVEDADVSAIVDCSRHGAAPIGKRVPAAGAAGGGDSLAYVAYTSGSTGQPKGCLITHHNVISFLRGTLPLFDLTADDRWSVFHSLSFDASVWELWGALATGATAVIVPDAVTMSPLRFLDLLVTQRVTVVSQVASYFKLVLDANKLAGNPAHHIRFLFSVGESVRLDLMRAFIDVAHGSPPVVANMYGPTETTVFAAQKVITRDDLDGPVRSPIGTALGKAMVEVRNDAGSLLPTGQIGEIWIAGETVGQGYLKRPELTAQRFVDRDGRRFYRTGDLGRELPNGELEFLGRRDQQVKLRGYRIEIEEVESVLRTCEDVDDVAVTVCTAGDVDFLVACVVWLPGRDEADSLDGLRRHAVSELPTAMRPDKYATMDALPRNQSEKLDRSELRSRANKLIASPAQ